MEEQFVTYDIAYRLKKLGFDKECMGFYSYSLTEQIDEESGTMKGAFGWEKGELSFEKSFFINNYSGIDFSNENWLHVAAPLWQEAIDFVESLGYYIYICPEFYADGINWNWQVLWYLPKELWTEFKVMSGTFMYGDNGEFSTRRDATIAALKRAIDEIEYKTTK